MPKKSSIQVLRQFIYILTVHLYFNTEVAQWNYFLNYFLNVLLKSQCTLPTKKFTSNAFFMCACTNIEIVSSTNYKSGVALNWLSEVVSLVSTVDEEKHVGTRTEYTTLKNTIPVSRLSSPPLDFPSKRRVPI